MQRRCSDARPFKQRKSLASRKREVDEIREKYPNKIPVVVERYHKEKELPVLGKTKFLVSQDLPMSQFMLTIRSRLCLSANQAFYLLVNDKSLPTLSLTMMEVYRDNQEDDGFLYITYASQEMFGDGGRREGQ
ncbi:UNVERIFIED_CONTAM: Microtubule-associated proteins 1A/1B light chain 3C [Gekko kuhli]